MSLFVWYTKQQVNILSSKFVCLKKGKIMEDFDG